MSFLSSNGDFHVRMVGNLLGLVRRKKLTWMVSAYCVAIKTSPRWPLWSPTWEISIYVVFAVSRRCVSWIYAKSGFPGYLGRVGYMKPLVMVLTNWVCTLFSPVANY